MMQPKEGTMDTTHQTAEELNKAVLEIAGNELQLPAMIVN
jgi:hypothetical protein